MGQDPTESLKTLPMLAKSKSSLPDYRRCVGKVSPKLWRPRYTRLIAVPIGNSGIVTICGGFYGAGDRSRTDDFDLGKVALYH